MPFLHPGQPLLPGPHISHGSDIAGDCELCVTTTTSTSLCCIFLHYKHCCIYLFTDVMMLLMLWWRDRRHWLQGGTRDTWHVFIPDISLHHYTRTTARSRATRILCYNSLLLWWWWTVMMAVCDAVMMPGAVKTLRWLAPRGMESMTRGPGAEVPVPNTFTNLWGGTTLAGEYKIQQTQCWMLPVYYYARLVIVSAALDPGLLIFVSRPGYKIWRPSQNVRRTLCSQPQSQQFPACAVPPAPFSLVKLSTGLCNISPCCLVTVLKNHFSFSKCLNS